MKIKNIRKNIITESTKYPLLILITFLIISYIYTFFHPLPSEIGEKTIGLGAEILNIGDRTFYFNETNYDYGYGDVKGGTLYPSLLKYIAILISKVSFANSIKLWNMIVIFFASLCSIISLILIDKSGNIIFNKKVATISNLIFVLSPYTFFYSLSGGITIYVTLGCSFLTYVVVNSNLFNKSEVCHNLKFTLILLSIGVLFLSSLRPTGIVFSLVILILISIEIYKKHRENTIQVSKTEKYLIYFIFSLCYLYCLHELKNNTLYLNHTLENFISEGGTFFGFEREDLRNKIFSSRTLDFNGLKSYFYLILWKITDFVSGLSDIRDTHSNIEETPLFPFFIRTFTGIFITFPLNLLSFLGTFIFFRKIYRSGLYIPIIASLLCLVPNLLGVAFTRYLIMISPPFIILASGVSAILINAFEDQKKNIY
ncbi:hypothetical protein CU311_08960 [Prochlorococcus marinus str. MU1402]|uniref:hypothetical protein n=1 Tax=Prochlorococcus marinus TaxID=1219 RepID=UPI001ADBC3AB|nr:hypothetical protein [Prochlorococcus marinus]MBO8232824.1 hypothetical protein [Prochlorococcus marinus XMU1402]MBW3057533.1 hypothetical protein [Prochlorococcus marinus str. MU1402]